jgi:hypothetical protein
MNRRRLSKSAKIRRALAQGNMSPSAIAAKYGSSVQTVYTIKSMMRKEGKLPARDSAPQEVPAGTIISLPPTATVAPSGIITLSEPAPVPPGGITYVSPPAAPTATVEARPSWWARFKLWAFGAR